MPINVSEERKKLFDQRVSDWLASQGILFQLRYAGVSGSGGLMGGILTLALRLLLVLLVASISLYFIGNHWMTSETFLDKISQKLERVFKAKDVKLENFSKETSRAQFAKIKVKGTENSFFSDGEMQMVTVDMPFSALWKKEWQAGEINMNSANLNLKSGGDVNMAGIYDVLFGEQEGFNFSAVTIKSTTLEWGYSKLTHGQIRKSQLRALREGNTWKLHFEGGYFQQNWLQGLQIKEMHLTLGKDGVRVDSAEFIVGESGKATMSGKISGTAAKPVVALKMNLARIPVHAMLKMKQVDLRNFIEGEFGGKVEIFGTSDQAIKTRGKIVFNREQALILRDGWPILKTLSLVDNENSYRRLLITEGGFSFETGSGNMVVRDLTMGAGDLFQLKGAFETHLPNQREAAKSLGIELTKGKAGPLDISESLKLEGERMSLDENDTASYEDSASGGQNDAAVIDQNLQKMTADEIDGLRLKQEMATHVFHGQVQVGVKPTTFEKHEKLLASFPASGEPAWSWIPLKLYSRMALISVPEAQAILDEARDASLPVTEEVEDSK